MMNAEEEVNDNNPYTVCIAYDKKSRSTEEFFTELKKLQQAPDDIIYIRSCQENKDVSKDQAYIVCLKKDINDLYSKNEEYQKISGIHINRLHPKNNPLQRNMTWAFFIKTDKINPSIIVNIFNNLESSGFIKKNSFQIVSPVPYPDGKSRDYLIVTFEKNNGSYPKKFIRKLRILLNNTKIGDENLKINWASTSVVNDVLKGENKQGKNRIN